MARPKQDPQIRINEILDAADALFHKRGYHKTMIGDIVKKVGVAHGTFYYYFKSKEEIVEAMIDRHLSKFKSKIEAMAAAHDTPLERKLESLASIMFDTIRYKNGLLLEFLYNDEYLYLKDKVFRQGKKLLATHMFNIIEEGKRIGTFKVQSPKAAVNLILAIMQCHIESIYNKESPKELAQQIALGKRLAENALGLQEGILHIRA